MATIERVTGRCSWDNIGRRVSYLGAAHLVDGHLVDLTPVLSEWLLAGSVHTTLSDIAFGPEGATWTLTFTWPDKPPLGPLPPTRTPGDHGQCVNCSQKLLLPTPTFLCDNCRRSENGRE